MYNIHEFEIDRTEEWYRIDNDDVAVIRITVYKPELVFVSERAAAFLYGQDYEDLSDQEYVILKHEELAAMFRESGFEVITDAQ